MAENSLNTIRERATGNNSEIQLNTYGLLGTDGRLTWSRGTASLNVEGCIRVTGNSDLNETSLLDVSRMEKFPPRLADARGAD